MLAVGSAGRERPKLPRIHAFLPCSGRNALAIHVEKVFGIVGHLRSLVVVKGIAGTRTEVEKA